VVDYIKLNEKGVGNAYPLPDITDILGQLGQAKYFSYLDLAIGYHQIDMDPKDIEKLPLVPRRDIGRTGGCPLG
jgi:hypothetical protein